MKMRPLGWELTTALLVVAALAVALLFNLESLTKGVIVVVAVATPIVLLSVGSSRASSTRIVAIGAARPCAVPENRSAA